MIIRRFSHNLQQEGELISRHLIHKHTFIRPKLHFKSENLPYIQLQFNHWFGYVTVVDIKTLLLKIVRR